MAGSAHLEMLLVAVVDQGVEVIGRFDPDITATCRRHHRPGHRLQ